MCKSKCSGSCMSLLKDKIIVSKESLVELNNLLNKITLCGAPAGINKNVFMSEIINLKIEARRLLNEVNLDAENSQDRGRISTSPDNVENIFENFSFKERLNDLKQKIHALSGNILH